MALNLRGATLPDHRHLRAAAKLRLRRMPVIELPSDVEDEPPPLADLERDEPPPLPPPDQGPGQEALGPPGVDLPPPDPGMGASPPAELQRTREEELEAELDANLGMAPCGCAKQCTNKLNLEEKQTVWTSVRPQLQSTQCSRDTFLFNTVKASMHSHGHDKGLIFFGKKMCLQGLANILGVAKSVLQDTKRAVQAGCLERFPDQRQYNGSNHKSFAVQLDADNFFAYLYSAIAETLSDADVGCQELQSKGVGNLIHEWVMCRDGNPLAMTSAGMTGLMDKKHLPYMTWPEVVDMYAHHGDDAGEDSKKAGRTCFDQIYNERWSGILVIRGSKQHARCSTCAALTKARREDPDPQKRKDASKAYKMHINRMMMTRRADERMTHFSELSTSEDYSYSGVLHIRIDGMDQAKFRVPRNLEDAKKWSSLWRPTLHTVGIIVEGLLEIYLIADADVRKDSNMECTALSYAIDMAEKELAARGLPMPDNLSVKFDNTGREGKNQTVLKYLAWNCAKGNFQSVQDNQAEVGHTHDKLDQRFSVVATILSRSMVLETPEDFLQQVKMHIQPAGNKRLVADYFPGSWDWQAFFEPAGIEFHGIAASQSTPDVCHCKRFVNRNQLAQMQLEGWSIHEPEVFAHLDKSPLDVVMCAKQWWPDPHLAQPPTVVFPHLLMDRLAREGPSKLKERNVMGERAVKEYEKTAQQVGDNSNSNSNL